MRNSLLYTPQDFFAESRNEAEVDNLLNTDVYKILMLDFILDHPEYKDLNVSREMKIRSEGMQTANVIPLTALKDQLEATKSIQGVSQADLSSLRGMTNNDGTPLLKEQTLEFLKNFRLPEYEIGVDEGNNYTLKFEGARPYSMMWEIYGLKIINSSYMYHYMQKENLGKSEFHQIINEAQHRLYQDIALFKTQPDLTFSEFGTRRGLSTDYHRMVLNILTQELPDQCVGTSNVMLARELGHNNPKGTNAHELRMIPTALYDDPTKIIDTMYDIDRQRAQHFPELTILLPDTYGTSFYFDHCPEDIAQSHVGYRVDSKDPHVAIPEYLEFLKKHNMNPQHQIAIPSDGLNASNVTDIHRAHKDSVGKLTYGIGTNLTNNTKHTRPRSEQPHGPFGSFSVVIKPMRVQRPNGERVSCVKLSDNPGKAMGEKTRVELFKNIFGVAGMEEQKVQV